MLSLSTDAEGVVRFETTRAARVVSLGAHRVMNGPRGGGDTKVTSINSFTIDGVADKFLLGVIRGFRDDDNVESWSFTEGASFSSKGQFNNESALTRAWALINKAFDDDLLVTVRGWVRNDAAPPSEATVRAALARAAAGEAVTIPAGAALRSLFVTDVVVTKAAPPGGGTAGGASRKAESDPSAAT